MNTHSLYSKVRRPLAILCMFALAVSGFFGLYFSDMQPKEERSGAMVLFFLLFTLWMLATSAGRLVTICVYEARYRWVNIFSLIFFICVWLFGAILPQTPAPTYEGGYKTMDAIFGAVALFWAYLSVALDVGEIFL